MPPPSAIADVGREVEPRIWRACAGSSVQIPSLHSRVYYFPQGHVEHCCSSSLIPSQALPMPFIPCVVSSVQLLADQTTDEAFGRLVLQPVSPAQFSSLDVPRYGGYENDNEESKILTFAKTLTPSDANNGGGFSVPRFCADSIFPPLDYKAEPPVQTLSVTDIHGVVWDFRHIFRGTPRRHLLTTGWSKFVNHKKLIAGDSVVFMKNLRGKMFVGIRRAIRSCDGGRGSGVYAGGDFSSWHDQSSGGSKEDDVGGLKVFGRSGKGKLTVEAVAEAVARAEQGRPFEVVYYPKAGWSDFVVKAELVEASLAVFWAPGMRVKMAMETEDSSRTTWFQGIISSTCQETGPWRGSPWRLLQVTWDEPEVLQNMKKVSPWQVELVATPNEIHPAFPRFKSCHSPGFLSEGDEEIFFPQRGWSSMTPGNGSPSLLKNHSFPVGMQGARQNNFRSFSFTNVMGENPPQVFVNNFSNMVPGLKRVSTELNIGSPPSDELSPNSWSSIHSSGTDLGGNQGPNSARVGCGISSFKLFGKTIHVQEPAESGLDDSGCLEEDVSKGSSATEEGLNNTLDLSLGCSFPEHGGKGFPTTVASFV